MRSDLVGNDDHKHKTFYSALAQLVEQLTVNQRVAGSSPAGGAISFNDLHTFQLTSKYPVWGFCGDFSCPAHDPFSNPGG